MRFETPLRLARLAVLALFALAAFPSRADEPVKEVRLYALDTGSIELKDLGAFSDTGEYDGKPGTLVAPSFIIRHPKGILVWDTGLGDKLAEKPDGLDTGFARLVVRRTLAGQLKALGLTPSQVTHVAFSHFHFDHTGNAALFGAATWIINRQELAWALSEPTPFGADPTSISGYKTAKTQLIDGDYDVFGDGTVRILKAPGHTPGHQVLMVKLKNAGTLILSGDLYHTNENRTHRRVPGFNTERADSLASIDRIERIIANTKARFVVQHSEADFRALPAFPAYLD
ncbi:MAG TPA: N-acyl homoserine lactonase family protein [Geothrix sp.]|uniref:N-acyl homoserine lactonase family protein n=1 Tax=Geothrix mesophila TaxID=2922723 RepID=UPI001FAD3F66|nr:N-acyl homoserine lactonase family protein [Geothrix sp. SG198]HJV37658.1 N-acyl homoserine lactonase family protein [Geothrix sp.]HJW44210.1 N-acyl homoserine lactonase family protein [Geothrix sp.]